MPNIAAYNASINALLKAAMKALTNVGKQQLMGEPHFSDESILCYDAHSLAQGIDQLQSGMSAKQRHHNGVKTPGRKDSNILMHHMLISEQTNLDFRACLMADKDENFLNVCDVRTHSIPILLRWQPYRYIPKYPQQPLHSQSRYILLASKIDTQTPFDRAAEEFKDINAKEKYMFVYDAMPHVVMLRGSHCDKLIIGLLFGLNKDTEVRECVRDWNTKVSWRAGVHPLLRVLWDHRSPANSAALLAKIFTNHISFSGWSTAAFLHFIVLVTRVAVSFE